MLDEGGMEKREGKQVVEERTGSRAVEVRVRNVVPGSID